MKYCLKIKKPINLKIKLKNFKNLPWIWMDKYINK